MSETTGTTEEMEEVLALLMDIYEGHPHALYSAGINPETAGTMDSMMEEVSRACFPVLTFFQLHPLELYL
jgi:hypothetical protein